MHIESYTIHGESKQFFLFVCVTIVIRIDTTDLEQFMYQI